MEWHLGPSTDILSCEKSDLSQWITRIQDAMPAVPDYVAGDHAEFEEQFTLLQNEMRERNKNDGQRRSCLSVKGKKLQVYLSPFEQLRLAKHNQDALKAIKGLHNQSVYQFWRDPREWKRLLESAREGDLEIGPAVHAALKGEVTWAS